MVVDRDPVFGALQLEGPRGIDEADLMFANAVVNQLAVALARVTSIEARERALQDDLGFLREAAASLGEGLLAVDLRGTITLFNRAAERLLGVAGADALGHHISEVLQVHRADGSLVGNEECPLTIAVRRGEPVESDDHLFGSPARAAFPVSCTAAPFRRGAILAFRDVMEVKRSEVEQRILAETSAVVSSSLDDRRVVAAVARAAVPGFADICFVDERRPDGSIVRDCVVFADAGKQHLAEHVRRYAPRPDWQTPQRRVIETGAPFLLSAVASGEEVAQDADHAALLRAIDVASMIAVPLVARGQRFGAITFATAESGRRYADRDLRLAIELARRTATAIDNARLYGAADRATKARDNLLGIVSHDLKSPLSVILMNTDVLKRAGEVAAQRTKSVESIRRSAQRMDRLLQDLLDTASIEAGHLVAEPRRVAAGAVLADAVEPLVPLATARSISLVVEVPDDLPAVLADPPRLHQVITNLVGNAIKFTPKDGTILVAGRRAGAHVELSVSDTGPGIPEGDLPRLFDRFWQARQTAKLGSGLGLYIVKGIVDAHHGQLRVESRVGAGSTFVVSLPIAPPHGEALVDSRSVGPLLR